jgi:putative membrane protein
VDNGKKSIPQWAEAYFNPGDLDKVAKAIDEVESRSVGEIVPVIVESSTPFRSVGLICELFLVLVLSYVATYYFAAYEPWALVVAFVGAVALGSGLAQLDFIRRWILPKVDKDVSVHARAELEFYRQNINRTDERVGILIFVSLLERRVVILADEGISKRIPNSAWQKIVEETIHKVKYHELGDGIIHAIELCGAAIADQFPHLVGREAKLSNQLVFS